MLVGIGSRRQEMDLAIAEPLDNFLVCVHASTKLPCIVDIDLVQFAPILRIHNLNDALHNDELGPWRSNPPPNQAKAARRDRVWICGLATIITLHGGTSGRLEPDRGDPAAGELRLPPILVGYLRVVRSIEGTISLNFRYAAPSHREAPDGVRGGAGAATIPASWSQKRRGTSRLSRRTCRARAQAAFASVTMAGRWERRFRRVGPENALHDVAAHRPVPCGWSN